MKPDSYDALDNVVPANNKSALVGILENVIVRTVQTPKSVPQVSGKHHISPVQRGRK